MTLFNKLSDVEIILFSITICTIVIIAILAIKKLMQEKKRKNKNKNKTYEEIYGKKYKNTSTYQKKESGYERYRRESEERVKQNEKYESKPPEPTDDDVPPTKKNYTYSTAKEETVINTKRRYKQKFLMTLNEKSAFWKIKEITDKLDLLLFTKVRMLDIVEPAEKENYMSLLNQVKSKHIDFVIINKKGFTICAIELDDSSHQKQKAIENDQVKDKALTDAGIPIIRMMGVLSEQLEQKLKNLVENKKK